MKTTLYHGTMYTGPIEQIDLSLAERHRSDYGRGFYMARDVEDVMENTSLNFYLLGGREGGPEGFIYKTVLSHYLDFDDPDHGKKYLSSSKVIDKALVDRIAGAVEYIASRMENDRAELAASWMEKAAALRSDFASGNDSTVQQYLSSLQRDFGFPEKDADKKIPTSADIFQSADISFMRAGSYVIFMSADLPELTPSHHYGNILAGGIINQLESLQYKENLPRLDPSIDRSLRFLAVDAVHAQKNGHDDAYDRFVSLRYALEKYAPELAEDCAGLLEEAELQAGQASGLSAEDIELRKASRAIVGGRPERDNGEGFYEYKDRVLTWYKQEVPDTTPEQDQLFLTDLRDSLYRDAQYYYAHCTLDAMGINRDPRKLESMILFERKNYGVNQDLTSVAYIESETNSLRSDPGIRFPDKDENIKPSSKKDGVSGAFHETIKGTKIPDNSAGQQEPLKSSGSTLSL